MLFEEKNSYICDVFRNNPEDNTYRKCFRTVRIHIESVFALSESENVAVFKRIKDNEQHSFLFRLCGQEVMYPGIPHIYSSVGYCIVYLIRVRHNLQIDRRNNLTLSLFYMDSATGLVEMEYL